MARVRIRFSVWWVVDYAHVFIQCFVVSVKLLPEYRKNYAVTLAQTTLEPVTLSSNLVEHCIYCDSLHHGVTSEKKTLKHAFLKLVEKHYYHIIPI